MSAQFVVKVQISLTTNAPVKQVLVYDERQTICQTFDSFPAIEKRVGPSMKRYFWAHIDKKKMLHLDSYAPKQEW